MISRNVLSRAMAVAASASASASSSSSAASSIASSSRAFHVASTLHAESSTSASSSSSSSPSSGSASYGTRGRRSPGGGRGGRGGPRAQLPPYGEWKHTDGKKLYEKPPPGIGPHWIADTPFPLNPSFNPPPPLPQAIRDEMWTLHASAPKKWGPRQLSAKYGIAMNRIEAVLRLKALEGEWKLQGKPLQSAFVKSMEKLLGSARLLPSSNKSSTSASQVIRQDSLADEASAASAAASSSGGGSGYIRGPVREETAESQISSGPEGSIIAEALKVDRAQRAKRLTVLPTGGPSVFEEELDSKVSKVLKRKSRPSLRITKVPIKSYAGAGVVARNQARADRRNRAAKVAAKKLKLARSKGEAVKQGKVIAV